MPEDLVANKKKVGAGFGVILESTDGKILMGRRHPDPDKADSAFRSAGEWSLPGGKMEWGESFEWKWVDPRDLPKPLYFPSVGVIANYLEKKFYKRDN